MIELPRACFVAGEIARARRVLLLRHQRPHADRAGLLARRHRGARSCRTTSTTGIVERSPFETIDEPGVGELVRDRGRARARGAARARGRHLRRARRRPALDPLLPRGRARLRQLLAVPRADRARGGRAGRGRAALRPAQRSSTLSSSSTYWPRWRGPRKRSRTRVWAAAPMRSASCGIGEQAVDAVGEGARGRSARRGSPVLPVLDLVLDAADVATRRPGGPSTSPRRR